MGKRSLSDKFNKRLRRGANQDAVLKVPLQYMPEWHMQVGGGENNESYE